MVNSNTAQSSRAEQMQFLRFAAFLVIFLFHAEALVPVPFPAWNAAVSSVSFFFVLSGAVTGYSGYAKAYKPGWHAVVGDMRKKLRKMYPLYFLVTLFTVFYSDIPVLLANHEFANAVAPIALLVRHLLLLQSWFPSGYFGYCGVGWFLSALFFLYLLNQPMMMFLKKTEKKQHCFLIFSVLIASFILITTGYCYLTRNADMSFLQYIFPPARMGEYLSGMVLGFMIRRHKIRQTPEKKAVFPFTLLETASLLFWIFIVFVAPNSDSWCNRSVCWIVPNLFVVGVFLCGYGYISRLFQWKPLVKLGDISFPCYILHQVVQIIYSRLSQATDLSVLGNSFAILICLSFTVLSALYLSRA